MNSHKVRMVEVDAGYEGQRIDNFLVTQLKGAPKSFIYRILRRGEVRVNKGRVKASYRLQAGDQVRVPPMRLPEPGEPATVANALLQRLESRILYEDKRLLVLNKPSGLAVHGGSGLNFGIIEAIRQMRPKEQQLELVHRLDRDTSGCLLIAKKRSALRQLHELIRANQVDKRYLALLAGEWQQDRMTADVPLLKNVRKSGERMVHVDPRGKAACTRFRVRERLGGQTLVEAQLLTGRTHQIRVHAAHLGTPILGDDKYGDDDANRLLKARGLRRLFLHAETLRFRWPEEQQEQRFCAPLDDELSTVLANLRAV